jgi:hypothetical protein
MYGQIRNSEGLGGKLEVKRTLGEKESKEIGWYGVDWVHLALDRGR